MVIRICWIILAFIHALPAFALFNPDSLTALYGVASDDPNFLLLHHRAALFLAVCVACLWAAFEPASRKLAALVTGISMVSFVILFAVNGQPEALLRIAIADLAGLPFLAAAAWNAFRAKHKSSEG